MPRKTKIGTEVAHVTCDSDTTFKVKRSKVKVTGGGGLLWRPPAQLIIIKRSVNETKNVYEAHHSPPECVRVAGEVRATFVLLGQVDEVRREDEAKEADVQRRYQLLNIPQTIVNK